MSWTNRYQIKIQFDTVLSKLHSLSSAIESSCSNARSLSCTITNSIVGYNAETEAFADLGMTQESKALIHLFHARTECKKNKYSQVEQDIQCKQIGIIGSGEISLGISQVSIEKDYKVILYENNLSRLHRDRTKIGQIYDNLIKQKRMTK